ncbi:MAG: hypothetical protein GY932_14415 [Arcobacter sp.]|nr:hypothetical protein [Arcobacter sp.]
MNKKLNPFFYLFWVWRLFGIVLTYFISRKKILNILKIDSLGRKIGLHELMSGNFKSGIRNILNPISLVRYFEYNYCYKKIMEDKPQLVLDLSSPRLFSLFIANRFPELKIVMANPDADDLGLTKKIIKFLKIKNIELLNEPLHNLLVSKHLKSFDCIYSISVIEHIAGEYEDIEAIGMLYKLLKQAGRLIITVPLAENKIHAEEFRQFAPYPGSHNVKRSDGTYFFQRVYNGKSIKDRLIQNHVWDCYNTEWWGEKEKGSYIKYHKSGFYNKGLDLRKFTTDFQSYNNFNDLPGLGICGCTLVKKE